MKNIEKQGNTSKSSKFNKTAVLSSFSEIKYIAYYNVTLELKLLLKLEKHIINQKFPLIVSYSFPLIIHNIHSYSNMYSFKDSR
jgi:hypothetical protein